MLLSKFFRIFIVLKVTLSQIRFVVKKEPYHHDKTPSCFN